MNEVIKYGLYFLLGGLLVSVSTYLGAHSKGFFAALASTVPVISGLTFILVYMNAGQEPTLSFAKNLIWLTPPWFLYVGTMIVSVSRLGFWPSFALAMTLYMTGVAIMRAIVK